MVAVAQLGPAEESLLLAGTGPRLLRWLQSLRSLWTAGGYRIVMGGNPWDRIFGSKPRSSGGAGADYADMMMLYDAYCKTCEELRDTPMGLEAWRIENGYD